MTDYETFSLITTIIGLVISAITLGIHIGNKDKNKGLSKKRLVEV